VLKEIRKRSLFKQRDWQEEIEQIVHFPLIIALWIVGLSYAFNTLKEHFGFVYLPYIDTFRNSSLVACASWACLRWIKVVRHFMIEKSKSIPVSIGTVHVLSRICSFTVLILSILLILQILGLNILPFLAFGGIGAAALGFAAREVIANFFGGIMLYITRPFMVGDTISVPSKNELFGVVEEIGWYMTQIRDVDMRPVYLPNALFSSTIVVNMSHMTHRRILETIKLHFEDVQKLPPILEEIKTTISSHSRIDSHLPFHVAFKEMGSVSLDILIDGYTLATRYEEYLQVKQEILLLIDGVLRKHGTKTFSSSPEISFLDQLLSSRK
jgi:MscS family membrane protein